MSKAIKTGSADGVTVEIDKDNELAVITLANNFDVHWMLSKRDNTGQPFAESHFHDKDGNKIDPSQRIMTVPPKRLNTDFKIDDFNKKVAMARSFSREVMDEYETMDYAASFAADGGKKELKAQFPASGYAIGKVIHAGKFFVLLEQGVSNDTKWFQTIKTNSVVSGADGFLNREAIIKDLFPIDSVKYVSAHQELRGRVNVKDYRPKNAQETQPVNDEVQLPINREQKEALMAYREAHGPDWKEKLLGNWLKAHYPTTPEAQRGLLQQIRNEQGPEWLFNLDDKDLYLGTSAPALKAKPTPARVAKASQKTMGGM